ncbi:hypothetical protein TNCV_244891 [Trichonephila clavipes]|uniref:Uncharacterized protein n=1 Tax=Trichonephila clavipes TaxID=2585209 RepID=A0A8X6RXB8_TRICX|nr:hypothetical protein TNCV_244891 [Trichonephila clavipes]
MEFPKDSSLAPFKLHYLPKDNVPLNIHLRPTVNWPHASTGIVISKGWKADSLLTPGLIRTEHAISDRERWYCPATESP